VSQHDDVVSSGKNGGKKIDNLVDALFGLKMEETLTCPEAGESEPSGEFTASPIKLLNPKLKPHSYQV